MRPCKLRHATHRFGAPKDWDEEKHGPCQELDVMHLPATNVWVSAWVPSQEELALLNAGHAIWLHVVGGQPAVALTVGDSLPEQTHDAPERTQ